MLIFGSINGDELTHAHVFISAELYSRPIHTYILSYINSNTCKWDLAVKRYVLYLLTARLPHVVA